MASDAQPTPAKQPVTWREVAAIAGVSVATASKALNGQGRMTAETRTRIRETAQRLGFRPNSGPADQRPIAAPSARICDGRRLHEATLIPNIIVRCQAVA